MNRAPIGIFDSGIGGLTVARAIYERLPHESTIYFGDTARVPYGPKSPETVRRYSLEILHWLLAQGVKAVVIACNTSTAHALRALQEATPVPVLGVIEPGARAAIEAGGGGPIGVIGTAGTIASDAYTRAIQALAPGAAGDAARLSALRSAGGGRLVRPSRDRADRRGVSPGAARRAGPVPGAGLHPLPAAEASAPARDGAGGEADRQRTGDRRGAARPSWSTGVSRHPRDSEAHHRFVVSDDEARFRQVGSRFIGERLGQAEVVPLG